MQQGAFLGLWLVANAAVFAWSMIYGRASHTTDPAMQLGRALGASLDPNGGVVLLPMLRRMLTWVRARWLGRVVPVDDAIDFHKVVGHATFGLAIARDIMHSAGRSDMITGLRTKTHMGQPDWEKMLRHIVEKHRPERVDVYFCGPHGLAIKLAPLCRRLGMTFREERF